MALPPPPVVTEPIVTTSTATHHRAFMSTKLPNFTGKEDHDKVDKWLKVIEKAFKILEIPECLWVKFGTHMLF